MVLLCSSHVEPKKSYSDLKSLNKNFKVTVVTITEKDTESLKNQNIDFNNLNIKDILSSNNKKK